MDDAEHPGDVTQTPDTITILRLFLSTVLSNQKNYTAGRRDQLVSITLLCLGLSVPASAQIIESTGPRALGMGGAFVAVASDSSAIWWNPGGLAAGPFMDMALARAATEAEESLPAWRHRTTSFTLATPPFGIGYYRFRLTDIQPFSPTGQGTPDREDRRVGLPARSLSASQLGVTLVQTLTPGVHAGTTLKYVRGTVGEGATHNRFDADVGVLAVAGPVRLGAVVRNVGQPEFEDFRLPRQVRAGAAFDAERATGGPLTVAVDADLRSYDAGGGDRRVVAAGIERWFQARRFGIRAGGRFNMVGRRERSATGGASVAVRSGVFVDGYAVKGGAADEEGWGLAARVSF
ncbi:MAG: hypothetical protein FJW14_00125 [Acidimicrobiia bacterium]|nr:hypothetical protein [Acidimicrobiia bacterium]